MEQTQDLKQHPIVLKTIFWLRMLGWLTTSCILPIVTVALKFGLFRSAPKITTDALGNIVHVNSYALNGWGILSCFLVGYTITQIMREILKSYVGYSLTKQVLEGILKTVIPLVIAYGVCYFLNGVIEQIMFCLLILMITRLVAIPLNPLPKWRYEKVGAEDYSEFSTLFTKFVKSFKEKGGS